LRVTKAVDIFSLGCILSEVVVWIAGGYKYLIEYRHARRKAIEQIPGFHGGDCFHNGTGMLPIVAEWHRKAQAKVQSTEDAFTPKFVPMIEKMLQAAQYRGDAMGFCRTAHKIFVEALADFRKRSPDLVIPDDVLPPFLQGQRQRTFDSDVESVSSEGTVFSCALSKSSVSSLGSLLDDAIKYVSEIFMKDSELCSLYREAQTRLDHAKLARNHDRLLRKYFKGLKRASLNDVQMSVVRYLRGVE
jgi:hypothetical protein